MALAVQRGYCLPRDTTPGLCSRFCCLPALHRLLARCAFPGETDAGEDRYPRVVGVYGVHVWPVSWASRWQAVGPLAGLGNRGAWPRHLGASLAQSAGLAKGDAGCGASSLAVRAASDDARAGRRGANEAVDMPLSARRWGRRTWRLGKRRRQRGMRFGLATDTLGACRRAIAVALAID